MMDVGNIFDFQLSATVFVYLTIGFMAAYGFAAACAVTRRRAEALQAA